MKEIKVTQAMIDAFLKEVDDEAFVLTEITDRMMISEDEGLAILRHVMMHDMLRLKCVWVPVKKVTE